MAVGYAWARVHDFLRSQRSARPHARNAHRSRV